jgi:hypothetical protein
MKHKAAVLREIPETKIKVKRFASCGNYISTKSKRSERKALL